MHDISTTFVTLTLMEDVCRYLSNGFLGECVNYNFDLFCNTCDNTVDLGECAFGQDSGY